MRKDINPENTPTNKDKTKDSLNTNNKTLIVIKEIIYALVFK